MDVLFEDNHCLAVSKPNGLLVMGDRTGDPTAHQWAAAYLKAKYNKPGAVFVGVVHRLDRPVSGVLLFARTSKGAARLSEQFRQRTIEKRYCALVAGRLPARAGRLEHWLSKDETHNRTHVTSSEGQTAVLEYEVERVSGEVSQVKVQLLTGRSHQIRVQLAEVGCPILGDTKYGAKRGLAWGIALHAASLAFTHPTRDERITLNAPPPPTWKPLLP